MFGVVVGRGGKSEVPSYTVTAWSPAVNRTVNRVGDSAGSWVPNWYPVEVRATGSSCRVTPSYCTSAISGSGCNGASQAAPTPRSGQPVNGSVSRSRWRHAVGGTGRVMGTRAVYRPSVGVGTRKVRCGVVTPTRIARDPVPLLICEDRLRTAYRRWPRDDHLRDRSQRSGVCRRCHAICGQACRYPHRPHA